MPVQAYSDVYAGYRQRQLWCSRICRRNSLERRVSYYLSCHAHHRQQANHLTGSPKQIVTEAFPDGLEYRDPGPLVTTRGIDWVFQPNSKLYDILASEVMCHYENYTKDKADKSEVGLYFYLGGAGTGKSRHGTEFASSIKDAITEHLSGHALFDELMQRLEKAFVFHVSFENGTPLMEEEVHDPLKAIGIRMLSQLLDSEENLADLDVIRNQYVAEPKAVFKLVAAKKKVDWYDDFTGILVVDGIQRARENDGDGRNLNSRFYRLMSQLASLSLRPPKAPGVGGRKAAPCIITCVTATCFGPVEQFLANSHSKRTYLPLNEIQSPIWKESNELDITPSPFADLLVEDVGGHPRAMEVLAKLLSKFQGGPKRVISEFVNKLLDEMSNYYSEALQLLSDHTLSITQCILSRREINLGDTIPGSNVSWDDVTMSGLLWFERIRGTTGHLKAPYIWLWIIARLPFSNATQHRSPDTSRLHEFLSQWEFNDYTELYYITTRKGSRGKLTWQCFEDFCCSFRALRSLGFDDGEKVRLKFLHSGCKLRDDRGTTVVNRHLGLAEARHQYRTDSIKGENPNSGKVKKSRKAKKAKKAKKAWKARLATEVDTECNGILNADAQLSHVIANGTSAPAGDFFFSIETPVPGETEGKIVREVGQCKFIKEELTPDDYYEERDKSAGPDDIFIMYMTTGISGNFNLPDRSGIVDGSCWEEYFGPFSGRAYRSFRRTQRSKK